MILGVVFLILCILFNLYAGYKFYVKQKAKNMVEFEVFSRAMDTRVGKSWKNKFFIYHKVYRAAVIARKNNKKKVNN